jgi:predicted  nucleic acid-binding Zn-ribbon protein
MADNINDLVTEIEKARKEKERLDTLLNDISDKREKALDHYLKLKLRIQDLVKSL